MTSHHPKFCIHTALQLVGLITEKLFPTALIKVQPSKVESYLELEVNP